MDKKKIRCAIYTRKSTEEGLEQDFNSLDAQREACEAYIKSQMHEGWVLIKKEYNDGGYSGGTMNRPAFQELLMDIEEDKVDIVVVYKVDRLTRSLMDFSKIIDIFDKHGTSFVSITQQFNTTTSMGRLTLNILLSFAQFEREVTGERIRDKIAASKKKGMWMSGCPPLGYKKENFENKRGEFSLVYLGMQESSGKDISFMGINENEPQVMVLKACQRALDENVANLQKNFEVFKIKAPLTGVEPLKCEIGLKEGVTDKSRYEVLEAFMNDQGHIEYKRQGIIRPVKGKIWDNRFMAIEERADNASLGFTTFEKVSGGDFYQGMLVRELK